MMLRAIRASGGAAIAVNDEAIVQMTKMALRVEGISMAFEGAATLVAARVLFDWGWLKSHEKIVCLNTGAGWKNP
jgi:threonine synthase